MVVAAYSVQGRRKSNRLLLGPNAKWVSWAAGSIGPKAMGEFLFELKYYF
jgi:hypothetical protein